MSVQFYDYAFFLQEEFVIEEAWTDSPIQWLTDWLIYWLTQWFNDWLTDSLTYKEGHLNISIYMYQSLEQVKNMSTQSRPDHSQK